MLLQIRERILQRTALIGKVSNVQRPKPCPAVRPRVRHGEAAFWITRRLGIARMFEMQVISDTLNQDEQASVLHGTRRTVNDVLHILRETDSFITRVAANRQQRRSQEKVSLSEVETAETSINV